MGQEPLPGRGVSPRSLSSPFMESTNGSGSPRAHGCSTVILMVIEISEIVESLALRIIGTHPARNGAQHLLVAFAPAPSPWSRKASLDVDARQGSQGDPQ